MECHYPNYFPNCLRYGQQVANGCRRWLSVEDIEGGTQLKMPKVSKMARS